VSVVEELDRAATTVRAQTALRPELAVVLGSGLGGFAEELADRIEIPYAEIPGWPRSTAVGHTGTLVIGTLDGLPLYVLRGRAHLYEGHPPDRVVFGVRVLGRLGVRTLVLTNAAGGIDPRYGHGALVLLTDHVNLQGVSPLVGPNEDELGPRFVDLSDAYDPSLRARAHDAAARIGLELHEGVYAAFLGPAFETPAEIRFARTFGADLVGMSTVPEILAARHLGIRCLAISCVTNMAAGLSPGPIDHEEVLEVGERVQGTFTALMRELLPRL
jgi:purine-nucleoside phosphorylase